MSTTSYTCNRCNKIYNHKSDYVRHINRKNPCPIYSEKNILCPPITNDRIGEFAPITQHIIHDNRESQNDIIVDDLKRPYNLPVSVIHQCPECNQIFSTLANLGLHIKSCSYPTSKLKCNDCGTTFSRKDCLLRHQKSNCKGTQSVIRNDSVQSISVVPQHIQAIPIQWLGC